jgi:hypothetical protein
VALAAHVSADPVVLAESPAWPLSAARADSVRRALGAKGLARVRVRRVTGHADRSPVLRDPMAPRNNRVEIILLRDDAPEPKALTAQTAPDHETATAPAAPAPRRALPSGGLDLRL